MKSLPQSRARARAHVHTGARVNQVCGGCALCHGLKRLQSCLALVWKLLLRVKGLVEIVLSSCLNKSKRDLFEGRQTSPFNNSWYGIEFKILWTSEHSGLHRWTNVVLLLQIYFDVRRHGSKWTPLSLVKMYRAFWDKIFLLSGE